MEMQKHGHDPVLFHDIQVRFFARNCRRLLFSRMGIELFDSKKSCYL